jgi:cytochrome P450
MVILDIFLGGSQTTSTAIDLALMTMVLYPEIQRKCHEEIERVVGADGELPSYADRHKTPYINAVILEIHRFYSFVVIGGKLTCFWYYSHDCKIKLFLGPRRALTDCKLQNFFIPKGTTVLIGLGDAQHDPTIWDDPQTFNPNRFLDEAVKKKLFPFGTGRRKCLGDKLANECIYKYLTEILNVFTLHKSPNEEDMPSVDLQHGIMLSPKPYKIVFKKKVN